MQFSSVNPEHFEGAIDYGTCRVNGEECYGCAYCPPEREIPFEGTNPPNIILVTRRIVGPVNIYWEDLPRWPSQDEIEHARKVMQRLHRLRELTGENDAP